MVEEFEVDVGLLREIRELEKEAARQLEHVLDKLEVTTEVEFPPLEEIVAAIKREEERRAKGGKEGVPLLGTRQGAEPAGPGAEPVPG